MLKTRFFNDNKVRRDTHPQNEYEMFGPHYDDALMREAVENVGKDLGDFCYIGNNCQDWADKVRQEYERLRREREQNLCQ